MTGARAPAPAPWPGRASPPARTSAVRRSPLSAARAAPAPSRSSPRTAAGGRRAGRGCRGRARWRDSPTASRRRRPRRPSGARGRGRGRRPRPAISRSFSSSRTSASGVDELVRDDLDGESRRRARPRAPPSARGCAAPRRAGCRRRPSARPRRHAQMQRPASRRARPPRCRAPAGSRCTRPFAPRRIGRGVRPRLAATRRSRGPPQSAHGRSPASASSTASQPRQLGERLPIVVVEVRADGEELDRIEPGVGHHLQVVARQARRCERGGSRCRSAQNTQIIQRDRAQCLSTSAAPAPRAAGEPRVAPQRVARIAQGARDVLDVDRVAGGPASGSRRCRAP